MNKSDLVNLIAEKTQLVKASANDLLDDILQAITHSLSNDGSITLVGFGTFAVRERKARMGRNPKTGKALEIPPSKVVHFRAGKLLKNAIQKD